MTVAVAIAMIIIPMLVIMAIVLIFFKRKLVVTSCTAIRANCCDDLQNTGRDGCTKILSCCIRPQAIPRVTSDAAVEYVLDLSNSWSVQWGMLVLFLIVDAIDTCAYVYGKWPYIIDLTKQTVATQFLK